jgi:hypothetical protein
MSVLDEQKLQREGDEIAEGSSFSWLSIIGLLSSLAGVFSLTYIQLAPCAIIGAVLGAGLLLTAKRYRLNWFARSLAFLAMAIGSTVASAGISSRMLETNSDLKQARQVAELYLKSLSAKDLEKVYFLAGIAEEDSSGDDETTQNTESRVESAKKRLNAEPCIAEIRNRKTEAKWVFVGLDGEYSSLAGYTYRLRFRDEGQTIPPEYWVHARKNVDKFGKINTVHWFVAGVTDKPR